MKPLGVMALFYPGVQYFPIHVRHLLFVSRTLSLQLRQNPVGLSMEARCEPRTVETQGGRLIEVERSVSDRTGIAPGGGRTSHLATDSLFWQNATLVAEKAALQGQLQHLEGQLGSLQGRAQELLLQSQQAQEHSSRLQVGGSLEPLSPGHLGHLVPFPILQPAAPPVFTVLAPCP